jgi:hypothetical protein
MAVMIYGNSYYHNKNINHGLNIIIIIILRFNTYIYYLFN